MRNLLAAVVAIAALGGPVQATDSSGFVIQLGETWLFQLDQGRPINARKVDANAKPAVGELFVTLRPQLGTTMVIANNSAKFYNYRALMMRRPGDRAEATSVCTVMSNGRMGFENWPYPIAAIHLSDFTQAPENSMVCR